LGASLRWVAILAGALFVLAAIAVAGFYFASNQVIERHYPLPHSAFAAGASEPGVIARGARLVHIFGCADCHGGDLHGRFIRDWNATSRNITLIAESYSDADFEHLVRHGLRPDGTSVSQWMPSDSFAFMSDSDLAAVISYIRSLPHAGAPVPRYAYSWNDRWGLLTGSTDPSVAKPDVGWFNGIAPPLDLGPRFAEGRGLAMVACAECHRTSLVGGGPAPNLSIVASYTRADFHRLMRTGIAAGNRTLGMMSGVARNRFSHLTDDEIDEIYNYLVARGQAQTRTGG
jgi:mono/diheme cytochrome c family protein